MKQTRQKWGATFREAIRRWVGHPSGHLWEEKCTDPACSRDHLGPGDQWNNPTKRKLPTLSEDSSYQTDCILSGHQQCKEAKVSELLEVYHGRKFWWKHFYSSQCSFKSLCQEHFNRVIRVLLPMKVSNSFISKHLYTIVPKL